MTTVHKFPSLDEIETAKVAIEKLERIIDSETETHKLIVNNEELQLPSVALKSLLYMLAETAEGNAVTLAPIRPNVTVHEAADFLNVSSQTILKLIDSNLLPSSVTDNRRTVAYCDLVKFIKQSQQQRLDALNQLSRLDQESENGY